MNINFKKIAIFIISLSIIALISIFYLKIYNRDTSPVIKKDIDIKYDIGVEDIANFSEEKQTETNNEIYGAAKNSMNADICRQMAEEEEKDLCMELIAIKAGDEGRCSKINDEKVKKDCVSRIRFDEGVGSKNMKLCSSIEDVYLRDACALKIITDSGYSREDCDIMQDGRQKDLCISEILLNASVNDKTVCASIPLEDLRQECEGIKN
ncbi:MAG: hypothetical protein V1770_01635 [bacterium]